MAKPSLILGLLAAALAVAVAAELLPATRTLRGPATPPIQPVLATASAPPGAEPVAALMDQILARPLFTEGRRPPAVTPTTTVKTSVDKPPRLSGILVAGADRRAIFEAGGKPTVGVVGTQMGGYRIVAITPERVTLQGPDGMVAMSLAYGTGPGAAPAPVPPSIIDQLNSGGAPPPGMPKVPTLQEMMANLPKTLPPTVSGIPLNDTRPPR